MEVLINIAEHKKHFIFLLFICFFVVSFLFFLSFFFVDKIAPRLHHKATVEIISKSLLNYNRKKSKIVRKRNIKKNVEAVMRRCSPKKVFLEISQNSRENTSVRVSFLIKFQACNFVKKKTLSQVFSCKF